MSLIDFQVFEGDTLHFLNLNKPQSVYSVHMITMALHTYSQVKHLPGARIVLEMEA